MRIPTLVLVALLAAGCTSPTIQRKSTDTSTTATTAATSTDTAIATETAADAAEDIASSVPTAPRTTGATSTTTTTTQSNPAKPDRLRTGSVREMVEYYPPVGTGTYAK